MVSEYEAWEEALSDNRKCEMRAKEGYPFCRIEKIIIGGTIRREDDDGMVLGFGGTFGMLHPFGSGVIEGNISSRWREFYAVGRISENELDLFASCSSKYYEGLSGEYCLKKKNGIWRGEFKGDEGYCGITSGVVEVNILSGGIYKLKDFGIDYLPGSCVNYVGVRDFWDSFSIS